MKTKSTTCPRPTGTAFRDRERLLRFRRKQGLLRSSSPIPFGSRRHREALRELVACTRTLNVAQFPTRLFNLLA